MDDDAERAPEMLPGLLHFIVMQYFGEDAAWEEMAAAPLATVECAARSRGSGPPRALGARVHARGALEGDVAVLALGLGNPLGLQHA